MPDVQNLSSSACKAVIAVLVACGSTGHVLAAGSPLAEPLCAVVKKLLPQVKAYKPEGARAQLVMAVAEKFDYDGVKLRSVQAEIDQATSASCSKERQDLLGILKMKSLSEAVR
jgi:hypothetical protein